MKSLPENVTCYKRTPQFDESSIPEGLRRDHHTKAGVWGKIVVVEGNLLYTIYEPREEIALNVNFAGVVEPEALHQVQPLGKVNFYVEFYR